MITIDSLKELPNSYKVKEKLTAGRPSVGRMVD